jgi:Uma2 family endonuclease
MEGRPINDSTKRDDDAKQEYDVPMSTIISTPPSAAVAGLPNAAPVAAAPARRADVVVDNKIIPGWIDTLEEYRRWAESDEYPRSGWVSYLNGAIWVDFSLEEFLTHNQIKQAFNAFFGMFLIPNPVGCFVPDRMLLVNEAANLSTEPDGLFYLWATMQTGRLRLVPGKKTGYTQLEGTPDAVLEIVSDGSEKKDLIQLRDLYWKAQIPEYWLVDGRGETIRFDILRHAADGYQETSPQDGWARSDILGHSFRTERTLDPLGMAQFVVQMKP